MQPRYGLIRLSWLTQLVPSFNVWLNVSYKKLKRSVFSFLSALNTIHEY